MDLHDRGNAAYQITTDSLSCSTHESLKLYSSHMSIIGTFSRQNKKFVRLLTNDRFDDIQNLLGLTIVGYKGRVTDTYYGPGQGREKRANNFGQKGTS
jgi:hypothetical protein